MVVVCCQGSSGGGRRECSSGTQASANKEAIHFRTRVADPIRWSTVVYGENGRTALGSRGREPVPRGHTSETVFLMCKFLMYNIWCRSVRTSRRTTLGSPWSASKRNMSTTRLFTCNKAHTVVVVVGCGDGPQGDDWFTCCDTSKRQSTKQSIPWLNSVLAPALLKTWQHTYKHTHTHTHTHTHKHSTPLPSQHLTLDNAHKHTHPHPHTHTHPHTPTYTHTHSATFPS
jgi:hypothetical protein